MRWLSKRSLITLLVISTLALFLTAACTGPEGDTGAKGNKGDTGAKGDRGEKGDTGDTGPMGPKGDTGDRGPKGDAGDDGAAGAKGDTGPAGPTIPTAIILVPKGETTITQPISSVVGSYKPNIMVYGSGFPAGEVIFVEAIFGDGASAALTRRSGDKTVSAAGTFLLEVRPSVSSKKGLTIPAGVITVQVTSAPSGVQASAPLLMVEPKE